MLTRRNRVSSSASLSSFLDVHRKKGTDVQTHTWFGSGSIPRTLSIPDADVDTLWDLIVKDVIQAPKCFASCPRSVSEKVKRDSPFRFFADLDFKPSHIRQWKEAGTGVQNDSTSFSHRLHNKLREIVLLYQDVVKEATGAEVEMVLSTRLAYKIHLHFPNVIVSKESAEVLTFTFAKQLQHAHPDLFNDDVVDMSVYRTGLRLLYCHKGNMVKPDKRTDEIREHELIFGKGSYCDAYYITDIVNWQQNLQPSVADVRITSLLVSDGTPLTPLTPRLRKATKVKGKAKGKERNSSELVTIGSSSRIVQLDDYNSLIVFLNEAFAVPAQEIRIEDRAFRGENIIVPTRFRQCPFAKRKHQSNQLYFVLSPTVAELRCHDEACKESKCAPFDQASDVVQDELNKLFHIEESTTAQRMTAVSASLAQVQQLHPKMNCSFDESSVTTSRLGGNGYLVPLKENRWCPLCQREHESPENCILTLQREQLILCNRNLANPISIPLSQEHMKVIFNVQNLHINVTTGKSNDLSLRDFGGYELFPVIHSTDVLNRLAFGSLCGRTRDVARYIHELMQGEYVYQDATWYWYNGLIWKAGVAPHELMNDSMITTYIQLLGHYKTDQQQGWLKALINDMGNINRRKPYIEDLECLCVRAGKVIPFDLDPHLIGFENVIFDSRDGSIRDHQAFDYITQVLPYVLPTHVDTDVRRNMTAAIEDIMPDPEVREFLLLTLALHLEGINRHSLAIIWTGVGGNGKSVLKNLMKQAFGHLHHESAATFLTSERPSSDKPCADLVSLELARSIFCSEPEAGKKANSGFLKFLTGKDEVKARNPHDKNFHNYMPRFLITLLCNAIPLFEGGDQEVRGLWRRLKIISFETVFVTNPTESYQRAINVAIEEEAQTWGPHFMLLLMEVYRSYLARNRTLHIPARVERNLEEQKEDNDPFPSWFTRNVRKNSGNNIHLHRVIDKFNELALLQDARGNNIRYTAHKVKSKLKMMRVDYKLIPNKRDTMCECTMPTVCLADFELLEE